MNRHFASGLIAAPALLVVFAAASIDAQSPTAPVAPADAAACKACHGPEGVSSSPTSPNLAGQKADYLEVQLKAFHDNDRKNELMNAIAAQLNEAQMHELAVYWSRRAADPHIAAAGAGAGSTIPARMAFPANFPADFTVYDSNEGGGALTKRYANAIAWKAAKAGKPLPDGSVVMQISYRLEKDAAGKSAAGPVLSYSGMETKTGWGASIPALLRNEDWGYAQFAPDKTPRANFNQAPCLACHQPIKAQDYVFSIDRLRAAAKRRTQAPGA